MGYSPLDTSHNSQLSTQQINKYMDFDRIHLSTVILKLTDIGWTDIDMRDIPADPLFISYL